MAISSAVLAGSFGITFLTELLLQLSRLTQQSDRYILQDDPMCGLVTGGMEECWWDCQQVRKQGRDVCISNNYTSQIMLIFTNFCFIAARVFFYERPILSR